MRTKVEQPTSHANSITSNALARTLRQLWLVAAADAAGPSADDRRPALELDDALAAELQRRVAELRERLAGGKSMQTVRRLRSDLLYESEASARDETRQGIESLKRTLQSEAEQARAQAMQRLRGMIQAKAFQAALREFNAAARLATLAAARPRERPPFPLPQLGMRWWSLDEALRELGTDRLPNTLLTD